MVFFCTYFGLTAIIHLLVRGFCLHPDNLAGMVGHILFTIGLAAGLTDCFFGTVGFSAGTAFPLAEIAVFAARPMGSVMIRGVGQFVGVLCGSDHCAAFTDYRCGAVPIVPAGVGNLLIRYLTALVLADVPVGLVVLRPSAVETVGFPFGGDSAAHAAQNRGFAVSVVGGGGVGGVAVLLRVAVSYTHLSTSCVLNCSWHYFVHSL